MSARDDYPGLAAFRGDSGYPLSAQAKRALDEIDRLRESARLGELMARAVIELVDEKAALEAEIDRLRSAADAKFREAVAKHEESPTPEVAQPSHAGASPKLSETAAMVPLDLGSVRLTASTSPHQSP